MPCLARRFGILWPRLVLASLLAADVQGFDPGVLRWKGSHASHSVLAPKAYINDAAPMTAMMPQRLTLVDFQKFEHMVPDQTPFFERHHDETITWHTGLCMEAVEHGVRINHCSGLSDQKWDCIPVGHGRHKIQLKGSNRCLQVIEASVFNEASVELHECTGAATGSWTFEDALALPTQSMPRPLAFSFVLRHGVISFLAIVAVCSLSFGALSWKWQAKAPIVALDRNGSFLNMDEEAGLNLSTALALRPDTVVRKRTGMLALPARVRSQMCAFTWEHYDEGELESEPQVNTSDQYQWTWTSKTLAVVVNELDRVPVFAIRLKENDTLYGIDDGIALIYSQLSDAQRVYNSLVNEYSESPMEVFALELGTVLRQAGLFGEGTRADEGTRARRQRHLDEDLEDMDEDLERLPQANIVASSTEVRAARNLDAQWQRNAVRGFDIPVFHIGEVERQKDPSEEEDGVEMFWPLFFRTEDVETFWAMSGGDKEAMPSIQAIDLGKVVELLRAHALGEPGKKPELNGPFDAIEFLRAKSQEIAEKLGINVDKAPPPSQRKYSQQWGNLLS